MGGDSGGECGLPTSLRLGAPTERQTPGANGVWWNAVDVGLLHMVTLSAELDLSVGSKQYEWLVRHLETGFDRSRTPWLLLGVHRPLYNNEAYEGDYVVSEHLAQALEPVLRRFAVDAVLAGHYHSVLVTCPIAFGECADSASKGDRTRGGDRGLMGRGRGGASRYVEANLREQGVLRSSNTTSGAIRSTTFSQGKLRNLHARGLASSPNATIHYTIGSAGASLDDATLYAEPWRVDFFDDNFGYMRLNATANAVEMDFVRNDGGEVFHRLTIRKD